MLELNGSNIQNLKRDSYILIYPVDSLLIISNSMDDVEHVDLTNYSLDESSEMLDLSEKLTKFFRKQNSTSFTFLNEFLKHLKNSEVKDKLDFLKTEQFNQLIKHSYFNISKNYSELTFSSKSVIELEERNKGFFSNTASLSFYEDALTLFCRDIITEHNHLFLKDSISIKDYVKYLIETLKEQNLIE